MHHPEHGAAIFYLISTPPSNLVDSPLPARASSPNIHLKARATCEARDGFGGDGQAVADEATVDEVELPVGQGEARIRVATVGLQVNEWEAFRGAAEVVLLVHEGEACGGAAEVGLPVDKGEARVGTAEVGLMRQRANEATMQVTTAK